MKPENNVVVTLFQVCDPCNNQNCASDFEFFVNKKCPLFFRLSRVGGRQAQTGRKASPFTAQAADQGSYNCEEAGSEMVGKNVIPSSLSVPSLMRSRPNGNNQQNGPKIHQKKLSGSRTEVRLALP